MTTKEQYLLETWPKTQAKGKALYMTGYALFYTLIVGIISLFLRTDDAPVKEVIVSSEYLVKLAIFATIGLVIAYFKWRANNRKYEALKQQHNPEL